MTYTEEERKEAQRLAQLRYNQTPKGRANIARKNATAAAKAAQDRYHAGPAYAAARARRIASGATARYQAEYNKVVRSKHPERVIARKVVNLAVSSKSIIRPDVCEACGLTRRLDAHHHLGYTPEHWLDIQWLCRRCHRGIHRREEE